MAGGLALPAVCTGMTSLAAHATTANPVAGVIFAVSAGFVGAAASIWQGKRAAQERNRADADEAEANRKYNHDIAKAVAKSIATVLEPLSTQSTAPDGLTRQDRVAIAGVIAKAEPAWLAIADRAENRFSPLLEDSVAQAIERDPANPALGKFGDLEMWGEVLSAMAAHTMPRRKSSPAGKAATNLDPIKLSPTAIAAAVQACHAGFARQFYNDLKHDLATKGQAFAGVHLRMMGELVVRAREQAKDSNEIRVGLDDLFRHVNALSQMVLEANRQRQRDLAPLIDWLGHLDGKLATLLEHAQRQEARSERIEGSTTRIETGVDDLLARPTFTLEQLEDAMRRILDERRILTSPGPSGESAPSTASLSTSTPAAPTEFTDEQKAIAHQALSSRDALVRASARIIEGQHDRARQEAAKAEPGVKAGLEQAARYFRVMGDSYYFQRQFDEAIPHYQRVLDTLGSMAAPNDLINLANALAQARWGDRSAQAERAIELYTRAIDLPGAPAEQVAKALFNRGVVHGQQNRPQEAIADYTRAIDLPGAPAEQVAAALVNRGITRYLMEGTNQATCADLDEALRRFAALGDQPMVDGVNLSKGECGCP